MVRSGEAGAVAEARGGVEYGVGVTARHSGLRDFWRLCKPNVMQLVIFTSAVAAFTHSLRVVQNTSVGLPSS